jgi:D-alanyl-D-alanine carboxypeptidase
MSPLIHPALAAALLLALSPARAQLPQPPSRAEVAARADSLVRAYLADEGPVSVSVAIVRDGQPLVRGAWGQAEVEGGIPATVETTYRFGSVAKHVTAALLLRLVDRERLSLEDTLGAYLTGLRPEWRPLTIAQLLNHTSGLQREYRRPERRLEALPTDTLIAMATRDTMDFAPGAGWSYSNTGYMLLGALVERLYGMPYGEVLRREIAAPLGLDGLRWCNDPELEATAARGYVRPPGRPLDLAIEINPALALGAGGICGTPSDLAVWNRALHGGGVLSPATYAAMITPRGAAAAEGYGFGIRSLATTSGGRVLLHHGGTPGYTTMNFWYPVERLSVTISDNTSQPPERKERLVEELVRISLGRAPAAAPSP